MADRICKVCGHDCSDVPFGSFGAVVCPQCKCVVVTPEEMTEKEYRSHPAVSRSDLWKMQISPEKYRYFHDNPPESTDALLFGQVFHKLVLEPDDFHNEFAVAPTVNRRTKAGKEEWEAFCEANTGKAVVSREMYDQASAMRDSLMKVPFAARLLKGEHEKPFFWKDEETGVMLKCRADIVTRVGDINIVADLKTCADASTEKFSREALRYGYDFQSAYYLDGVNQCTGNENIFVFIAIEKEAPYAVNILQADDLFVQHGEMTKRDLLQKYAECSESGNWWGYLGKENEINRLELPAWIARNME